MVNIEAIYHFRGSNFFQGGGGGGGGGGGQLLIPYRNPNNLLFSRGVRTPSPLPTLDPHLFNTKLPYTMVRAKLQEWYKTESQPKNGNCSHRVVRGWARYTISYWSTVRSLKPQLGSLDCGADILKLLTVSKR